MGVSQSKKYTKNNLTSQIQLDYKKPIRNEFKILSNWSIEQIRQVCLTYKRYSLQCPYLSRFTLKKILPLSDRITNQLFLCWTGGKQKYVLYYQFVCGLVLLAFNTMKRKLQCIIFLLSNIVLYLVFNLMHTQSIKLKHYMLMFQCMTFAYCRLTDQPFPSFSALKKYLFQEYLTSESVQILEGSFEFRRLIEQVEVNQITRQLFMRFEGNVLGAKDKPQIFMLNGMAKYDKQQSQKIFRIIRKVYEQNNFQDVQQNQNHKKQRLQTRKTYVLQQLQKDKSHELEKTRNFRIKNRSYSLKNFDGFGSKIIYKGLVTERLNQIGSDTFLKLSSTKLRSQSSGILINTMKPVNSYESFLPKKSKQFSSVQLQRKSKQLTSLKLLNIPSLNSIKAKPKLTSVVFLSGKAYTKGDFFETIQYFNSLSNNKDEIKMKQFFKTFQNKAYLKRQLYTLFNFFDKNSNGSISFEEFIKSTYPGINHKLMQRLKQWNIDYKNIYQADKVFIKKQNKKNKIQLPQDTTIRINQIFLSFGGNKGYLNYQDVRAAYSTGFSMQQCQNVIKQFGIDGKIYLEGFGRMLLPQGFVIENHDWHIKRTKKPIDIQSS